MNERPRRLALWIAPAVVIVLVAIVALVVRRDDPKPGAAGPASSAGSSPAGGGPSALPLGSVGDAPVPEQGKGTGCPASFECRGVRVTCPKVSQSIDAVVAVAPSSKPKPSGLVLFLSGGAGTKLWSGTERVDPYFTTLGNDGLEVVQIQWGGEGWLASAPGEQVGPAVLACRSATVIKWAYDTLYTPMGLPAHSDGICGFCVTGNSAGASQTSYAMTHYGLETIVDHAVLTSGPPHAALGRGCLGRPGDDAFAYDGGAVGLIDLSYGARDNGPCHRHDASFADQFARDSADGSQGNYTLTHAFVTFIFGDADPSVAPIHADALVKVITPLNPGRVTVVHVPKQPHEITESPDGLAALRKVLTGR